MSFSDVVNVSSSGEAIDNDDITVDDTEGGIVLLEANPSRRSALILNVGDADMRVTTDGSAPTENHGKLVVAGGGLVLSSPYCPTKEVKAFCSSSTNANASEVN